MDKLNPKTHQEAVAVFRHGLIGAPEFVWPLGRGRESDLSSRTWPLALISVILMK